MLLSKVCLLTSICIFIPTHYSSYVFIQYTTNCNIRIDDGCFTSIEEAAEYNASAISKRLNENKKDDVHIESSCGLMRQMPYIFGVRSSKNKFVNVETSLF